MYTMTTFKLLVSSGGINTQVTTLCTKLRHTHVHGHTHTCTVSHIHTHINSVRKACILESSWCFLEFGVTLLCRYVISS